jgi:hypothetical protein
MRVIFTCMAIKGRAEASAPIDACCHNFPDAAIRAVRDPERTHHTTVSICWRPREAPKRPKACAADECAEAISAAQTRSDLNALGRRVYPSNPVAGLRAVIHCKASSRGLAAA